MKHRAIELFCGIGGFRRACDALQIDTIWANDISAQACAVYRDNFGNHAVTEGDIRHLKAAIPEHDLLTGGFPCQPFSSAGKKAGISDPRGTLFLEIVDILKQREPQFFVLENVKRLVSMQDGTHFAAILAELSTLNYAIEWRILNAAHLGLAQNRERIFIIGTRVDAHAPLPCVKLATERDLEQALLQKYDRLLDYRHWPEIARHAKKFPSWGLAFQGKFFGHALTHFSEALPVRALHTVLQPRCDASFDYTEETRARIAQSTPVNKFVRGVKILYNQGGGARMGYTIFGADGLASTLTASTSRHYERYAIDNRYRRLTNVEYARLQGFPDDHCRCASVYDQYALYGNAVPPPMACWVLEKLRWQGTTAFRKPHRPQHEAAYVADK